MTITRSPLDGIVGAYGPDFVTGVVTDHLYLVPVERVRRLASGNVVIIDDDRRALPLLCSELVEIPTEDGPMIGRCGTRVIGEAPACPGHAAEIAGWRAQTEAEALAWERRLEEVAR